MNIDKLEAGPELDALIAEKVMGVKLLTVEEMQAEADRVWKDQPTCRVFMMGFEARQFDWGFGFKNAVPAYSSEISAAWEVVRKLSLMVCITHCDGNALVEVKTGGRDSGHLIAYGEGPIALGICRAALKAVGA